ncbi:hypothetical protein [Legionella nagasakiensis]|uniref:hypothetical protein n=1 Tax=Legionella nagasakiensis TaxID=535290 RepID=UPI0010560F9B|nr:hypothetical protein [Legionella nagasakiensis]
MISNRTLPEVLSQQKFLARKFSTSFDCDHQITQSFLSLGISSFNEAVNYIHSLPYGRNTSRKDYRLVLKEGRGTCSTKHALIKSLADENRVDLDLLAGVFLMTESNAPAISQILKQYNVSAIPEAHCYLRCKGKSFDITFPDKITDPTSLIILEEISISPEQIGEYKINFHQNFIRNWINSNDLSISYEDLWSCREKCINALSEAS